MGPEVRYTPANKLPTQDTVLAFESTNGKNKVGISARSIVTTYVLTIHDERIEQDTESVCDAIENEIAHEAGEADDPAPALQQKR